MNWDSPKAIVLVVVVTSIVFGTLGYMVGRMPHAPIIILLK